MDKELESPSLGSSSAPEGLCFCLSRTKVPWKTSTAEKSFAAKQINLRTTSVEGAMQNHVQLGREGRRKHRSTGSLLCTTSLGLPTCCLI